MPFDFPFVSPILGYLGPGLSAGAVAVVLGIVGSIFLALFAVVWYPLKRLLQAAGILSRQKRTISSLDDGEDADQDEEDPQSHSKDA
ncbi:hypothetical protein GC197_10905 [bacterium]|nr:hypothetical protein [bacterium]